MLNTLPLLMNTGNSRQQGYAQNAGTPKLPSVMSPSAHSQQHQHHPHKHLSRQEKRELGELVSLRAREEGIRDFVSHCAVSCGKGLWAKVSRRYGLNSRIETLPFLVS
jgi:hypothetical protein